MSQPQAIVPVLTLLVIAGWAVACGDGATEPSTASPEPPRAMAVAAPLNAPPYSGTAYLFDATFAHGLSAEFLVHRSLPAV